MELEYISVLEASKMIGKSTSSVYRAIEQYGEAGDSKKEKGRQMVSKEFILRMYPTEAKRNQSSGTTGMEVERLWGEIEFLRSQLEVKDSQISELLNLIRSLRK